MKSLLQYRVGASDGVAARVHDVLFDDRSWSLQHIVGNTGGHLRKHLVLISPETVRGLDWVHQWLSLSLTREEIERCPALQSDEPVYRQIEEQLKNYYEWAAHWTPNSGMPEPQTEIRPIANAHLRSLSHLLGFPVQDREGPAGSIADFIVDDATWQIKLLVVRTGAPRHERQVAVNMESIDSFDWDAKQINLNVERSVMAEAPDFNLLEIANTGYEDRVREHFSGPVERA